MAGTLRSLTEDRAQIRLKWPNDVLLDGAKLTGILVERLPLTRGKAAVVVGIGINVAHAPPQTNYPVTSLMANGFSITPPQIIGLLSHFWAMYFDLWHEKNGFECIREKWLSHAAGVGQEIHIKQQGRKLSGLFKTIDEQGRLVLKQDNGVLIAIAAGDVYFGEVATWQPDKN